MKRVVINNTNPEFIKAIKAEKQKIKEDHERLFNLIDNNTMEKLKKMNKLRH